MQTNSLTHKKDNPHETIFQRLSPLIILLSGALLRLIFLGSVPGGMHQDESFVAWNAYALLNEGMDSAGHVMPVYMADWGDGHSALYTWLLIPLLALFGGGHVTPFLSRLPQALVSIATLWTVYCVVKRMLGKNAALIGMLALAICPWHIMMSRWGLDANLAPGFLMFGFYFFVRGLEDERYLLLSGFLYGICLYSYAVIWPIVPIMLALQIVYGLYHKRLRINKWSLGASLILFALATPLILFVLVNSEILPQIELPFLTIPRMGGYRGGEIALSPSEMWQNLYSTLYLLAYQQNGTAYDVLLPYGLFYDIGRFFMVIGVLCLVWKVIKSFFKKEFCYEYFLFVQLVGGGINCLLVTAVLHQINSLYIPLVLAQGYGILITLRFLYNKKAFLAKLAGGFTAAIYLISLVCFQRDYYTDYREVVNAYFGAGLEESVNYALTQCTERNLSSITVEKAAQWPRLLLYTETLPSQYLSTVEYDVAPAPAAFTAPNNIRINTRVDYEQLREDSIYIIYFTDIEVFAANYELTQFRDWYVAVPK